MDSRGSQESLAERLAETLRPGSFMEAGSAADDAMDRTRGGVQYDYHFGTSIGFVADAVKLAILGFIGTLGNLAMLKMGYDAVQYFA